MEAEKALITAFKNGNKLLIHGNGGSSADCEHIVGELMKGFLSKRPLTEELCICVPETETLKVQELHLPVYHYLCARVEKSYFKSDKALKAGLNKQ